MTLQVQLRDEIPSYSVIKEQSHITGTGNQKPRERRLSL